MHTHSFRLKPNQDLKASIENYVIEKNIKAGVILSAVGSLKKATIRLADETVKNFEGPFEIVSLIGTLSPDGCHLHISISDKNGLVLGGHLKENCIIHTTAEIVLAEISDKVFKREYDENTGFKELLIH
ncbi:MAG: DNA-binding protein [Candidatus Gracilibacteria bacterium]|jgi:predicted DNA-binding protein with PD1-like motif|nr:DNA-binding protein [Candidatus Gracilibacteria bacterium]